MTSFVNTFMIFKRFVFSEDTVVITTSPFQWTKGMSDMRFEAVNFLMGLDDEYEAAIVIRDEVWVDPFRFHPVRDAKCLLGAALRTTLTVVQFFAHPPHAHTAIHA